MQSASMVPVQPPLLIMTATIAPPPGATRLVRLDPQQRLADYCASLRWQMRLLEAGTLSGIVFVDNSGHDLSVLQELARDAALADRVEFISFEGLDYPPAHGRAYGEFLLLRHAMQVSALIAEAPASQMIWKLTGRYVVVNLARILARAQTDKELFVHLRNHPSPWADMYLMGWRKASFETYLAPMHAMLKEDEIGRSAEFAFRTLLDAHPRRERIQTRLRPPPELVGVRGFDGHAYQAQAVKLWTRRVADVVAPWVWI